MKKLFFSISLFLCISLLLGFFGHASALYSEPAKCRAAWTTVAWAYPTRGKHYYSCEIPSQLPTVCNGQVQSCLTDTVKGSDKSYGCLTPTRCCICTQLPQVCEAGTDCTTSQPTTAPILGCTSDAECNTWKQMCDTTRNKCICDPAKTCCGIKLNTNVPFIWNCIERWTTASSNGNTTVINEANAFPVLVGSLTKILMSLILIVGFVLIVIGGIMISSGNAAGGKKMIMKVVIGMALLWASGVILRLINPNFFG